MELNCQFIYENCGKSFHIRVIFKKDLRVHNINKIYLYSSLQCYKKFN